MILITGDSWTVTVLHVLSLEVIYKREYLEVIEVIGTANLNWAGDPGENSTSLLSPKLFSPKKIYIFQL